MYVRVGARFRPACSVVLCPLNRAPASCLLLLLRLRLLLLLLLHWLVHVPRSAVVAEVLAVARVPHGAVVVPARHA